MHSYYKDAGENDGEHYEALKGEQATLGESQSRVVRSLVGEER